MVWDNNSCTDDSDLFTNTSNGNHREEAVSPGAVVVVFGIPAVSGSALNLLIICVVCLSHRSRTKPFMFLLSMCASDLLMAMFGGPLFINQKLGYFNFGQDFFCRAPNFLQTMVTAVLALSLSAVSIERYVVICHPFKAKTSWTRRRCRWIIITIWSIAVLLGALDAYLSELYCSIVGWKANGEAKVEFICGMKPGTGLVMPIIRMIALFTIPVLIMIFCYGSIIKVLWKETNVPEPPKYERQGTLERLFKSDSKKSETRSLIHRATTLSITSMLGAMKQASVGGSLIPVFTPPGSPRLRPTRSFISRTSSSVALTRNARCETQVRNTRKRWIRMLIFVLALFVICYVPKLSVDLHQAVKAHNIPEEDPTDYSENDFVDDYEQMFASLDYYDNYDIPTVGDGDHIIITIFDYLFNSLILLHSTINPLLYLFLSQGVRDACLCRKSRNLRRRPTFTHMNTLQRLARIPMEGVIEEKF